jgi:hypothetical protein
VLVVSLFVYSERALILVVYGTPRVPFLVIWSSFIRLVDRRLLQKCQQSVIFERTPQSSLSPVFTKVIRNLHELFCFLRACFSTLVWFTRFRIIGSNHIICIVKNWHIWILQRIWLIRMQCPLRVDFKLKSSQVCVQHWYVQEVHLKSEFISCLSTQQTLNEGPVKVTVRYTHLEH